MHQLTFQTSNAETILDLWRTHAAGVDVAVDLDETGLHVVVDLDDPTPLPDADGEDGAEEEPQEEPQAAPDRETEAEAEPIDEPDEPDEIDQLIDRTTSTGDDDIDTQIFAVLAHEAHAKADAIAMVIGSDRDTVMARLRDLEALGMVKRAGPYGWQRG